MNPKEIKELIELLVEKDIAEFEMERGDVKLHIKRAGADRAPQVLQVAAPAALPVAAAVPITAASLGVGVPEALKPAASVPPPKAADDDANLHIVKSPIVGTFYD